MSLDAAGARNRSGLAVLWDVIVAPRAAFTALRERPYAGWAFLITAVLGVVGALLMVPAGEHIATATFGNSHNPQMASLTPEQQKRALDLTLAIQRWFWIFTPAITALAIAVSALVMLIANALGRGDGTFRRFFALASNVAIVNFGLNYVVLGALVFARGGDSFSAQRDLTTAIPSLAWLVPPGADKLATFLAAVNPFQIWSLVLLALGMQIVGHVKPVVAWVTAVVLVLGPALIALPLIK